MFQGKWFIGTKFGVGAKDIFWIENSFNFLIEGLLFFREILVGNNGFNATLWVAAGNSATVFAN